MSEAATITSRIGRKPVVIPTGVDVKLQDHTLTAKGPKGNLVIDVHRFVNIAIANNEIVVQPNEAASKNITGAKKRLFRSIVGTTRANIYNMIHGVSQGFEKKLSLVGVGYRAQAKGKVLALSLGYSHNTDFDVPENVVVETPTQTEIIIKSANKHLVGQVAAKIRRVRAPEVYKGKGVRYADEVIELKETKKK